MSLDYQKDRTHLGRFRNDSLATCLSWTFLSHGFIFHLRWGEIRSDVGMFRYRTLAVPWWPCDAAVLWFSWREANSEATLIFVVINYRSGTSIGKKNPKHILRWAWDLRGRKKTRHWFGQTAEQRNWKTHGEPFPHFDALRINELLMVLQFIPFLAQSPSSMR